MSSENNAIRRALVASALHDWYPASIRSALLSQKEFADKYGFQTDAQMSFGGTDVTVSRTQLFNAIRSAFAEPTKQFGLSDNADRYWQIEFEARDTGQIALCQGKKRLVLPEFWMLLPDTTERLGAFERATHKASLPNDSFEKWHERLSYSALSDDEVDILFEEFKDTPIHVANRIASEVGQGSSSFDSLVPPSLRYFERLVGHCGDDCSLESYVEKVAKGHCRQLCEWDPVEGLKLALLLSAHSSITASIDISRLTADHLKEVFEFLANKGDRFSQLGGIELGLTVVDRHPELEHHIASLIEEIRDDDTEGNGSRFKLTSTLIVLADGELSRSHLFLNKPPFWRRLAAIAQASLIERCVCNVPVDVAQLSEWTYAGRGQQFYLQTLCDLRREPKWMPDFVSPDQLKAEFLGRIANAGQANAAKINSAQLKALLTEGNGGSVKELLKFPFPYFPGPLEGGTVPKTEILPEIEEMIDEALAEESIDAKSFAALINSALIFKLDSKFAKLAVQALRRARHYIKQKDFSGSAFSLFSGLAVVAAVTRSNELADDLRILIRRSMLSGATDISMDDLFRIGMVAAASRTKQDEWCAFVGDWTTELAFKDVTKDEAERLHSHILCLCRIVPELWITMGRADAALASVNEGH